MSILVHAHSVEFVVQSALAAYQLPIPARLCPQTALYAAFLVVTKFALLSACFSHHSQEVSPQLHPHSSEEQLGFDSDTPG